MNAILMAITVTLVAGLDYYWDDLEGRFQDKKRAIIFKRIVVGSLLIFVWIQAGIQFKRDAQSDGDMKFLKEQLALANTSLTNSTAIVKGMTIGGDCYADLIFWPGSDTNTVVVGVITLGEYPLREVAVKIANETKRINAEISNKSLNEPIMSSNLPPSEPILERYLGDLPRMRQIDLCSLTLDPAVTNRYRFDITAMNGSSWQIINIFKTTNGWANQLFYRSRLAGDKSVIEPSSWGNSLLLY